MAAPTYTARTTPSGINLKDGYKSLITLALLPGALLWEEEVTPSGRQGGEPINTTTMHNTTWRTKYQQSLMESTEIKLTCAYDPAFYNDIPNLVNKPTTVSTLLSDGTTIAEYGYLKDWIPGPLQIGQMPKAQATIVVTNWDHVNKIEAGPTIVATTGT